MPRKKTRKLGNSKKGKRKRNAASASASAQDWTSSQNAQTNNLVSSIDRNVLSDISIDIGKFY